MLNTLLSPVLDENKHKENNNNFLTGNLREEKNFLNILISHLTLDTGRLGIGLGGRRKFFTMKERLVTDWQHREERLSPICIS